MHACVMVVERGGVGTMQCLFAAAGGGRRRKKREGVPHQDLVDGIVLQEINGILGGMEFQQFCALIACFLHCLTSPPGIGTKALALQNLEPTMWLP